MIGVNSLHFVPSLLTPGAIASTSRLLGAGLAAAATPHGAAAAGSPLLAARWAHATATPVATPEAHLKQRLPAHEQTYAPPTSLKAGGSFAAGAVAPHPGIKTSDIDAHFTESHMPHPTYTLNYLESVRPTHLQPEKLYQHVGMRAIQVTRWLFDRVTGYSDQMTEAQWLRRVVFLETVAGVPGMVAGMVRHLKSLRTMQRDHGWISTLLEEAENERMHLITFLEMRKPGPLFRAAVIGAQGVFFNAYFLAYLLAPRTCHAFVGFLEEEAVKTYTHALAEIDAGRLWNGKPAPRLAVQYWGLPEEATMRDLILAVRADEACHAHVNHTFSKMVSNQTNPFAVGASQLP